MNFQIQISGSSSGSWISIISKSSNGVVSKGISSYCKSFKITYDDSTRHIKAECFGELNCSGESTFIELTLTEDDLTKTYCDDKIIKIEHQNAGWMQNWGIDYSKVTWSDNGGIDNYCIDVPRWNKFVKENPSYPIQ